MKQFEPSFALFARNSDIHIGKSSFAWTGHVPIDKENGFKKTHAPSILSSSVFVLKSKLEKKNIQIPSNSKFQAVQKKKTWLQYHHHQPLLAYYRLKGATAKVAAESWTRTKGCRNLENIHGISWNIHIEVIEQNVPTLEDRISCMLKDCWTWIFRHHMSCIFIELICISLSSSSSVWNCMVNALKQRANSKNEKILSQ